MRRMIRKSSYIFLFTLLVSCDFTSGINKDILNAQELTEDKNYREAATIYENLLNASLRTSIRTKIHLQLAQIYTAFLPDLPKAIFHYKEVLKSDVEPIWQIKALEKLSEVYFSFLKDYRNAFLYYDQLINFHPPIENRDTYLINMVACLVELGDAPGVEQLIKKHNLDTNPATQVKVYWYKGLLSYYFKNWQQAITDWKTYLKYEQDKDKIIETKFLMANSYEMDEKLREAYNIYYSLLNEYPNKDVINSRINSLYSRRAARKR
jgi:tetratricopeptide (TPR) repeat protein